jgi:hypothetical protein
MRSVPLAVARGSKHCQLPISDCQSVSRQSVNWQLAFGNRRTHSLPQMILTNDTTRPPPRPEGRPRRDAPTFVFIRSSRQLVVVLSGSIRSARATETRLSTTRAQVHFPLRCLDQLPGHSLPMAEAEVDLHPSPVPTDFSPLRGPR